MVDCAGFCQCVLAQIGLHNDGDFGLFDWTDKYCRKLDEQRLLSEVIAEWPQGAQEVDSRSTYQGSDVVAATVCNYSAVGWVRCGSGHHRLVYRRWMTVAFGGLEQEEDGCTTKRGKGYGALRYAFFDAQYHVGWCQCKHSS